MGKKLVMDASGPELMVRGEVDLQREGPAVVAAASLVEVNQNIDKVQVSMLPSIHAMVNSVYSVIFSELRRFDLRSSQGALTTNEMRNFDRCCGNLVKVANLEMGIRESSELEVMSDEKVVALTKKTMRKMKKAEDSGE